MVTDELARLQAWSAAFASMLDVQPVFAPLVSDVPDLPPGLLVIDLPRAVQSVAGVGDSQAFGNEKPLRHHLARYGFAWDPSDGRVVTMPTPHTYETVRACLGRTGEGFTTMLPPARSAAVLPHGEWLLAMLDGHMPLALPAPASYPDPLRARLARWSIWPPRLSRSRWSIVSFVHDTSLHLQNYVCVPMAAYARLGERIRQRIPTRYESWARPGTVAPLTLTHFLDHTFNTYCHRVWFCVNHPDEYARTFAAPVNFDQLLAALDVRLAETERGVGDVRSGQFEHMRALAPIEFTLQRG